MGERKPLNILFLCNRNTARSIMAEAMLNHMGRGNIRAYSAGSLFQEGDQISPYALKTLADTGIDTSVLRSKSWQEFMTPDAPEMDIVITMYDEAAGEVSPLWKGQPATANWNYKDPNLAQGSEQDKINLFSRTVRLLHNQLDLLINLPIEDLDDLALEYEMRLLNAKAEPATPA